VVPVQSPTAQGVAVHRGRLLERQAGRDALEIKWDDGANASL
jgi:hypothetical protein